MQPNHHATTRQTEQLPLDQGDVLTAKAGLWEQIQDQPITTMDPSWGNDVQGELMGMQRAFHLVATNDRSQLARMFERGVLPPSATLPIVDQVIEADILSQAGRYVRYGSLVWYGFEVTWGNNNAAIEAAVLELHIPFQTVNSPEPRALSSWVSINASDLGSDNFTAAYEFYPNTFQHDTMGIQRTVQMGGASFDIIIGRPGGVDLGSDRNLRAAVWYQTNGVRNPDWPRIDIVTLSDVYPALPSAQFDYEYDSAKIGDLVELLESGVPTGTTNAVTTLPAGRGTFAGIVTAGTYSVRLRQIDSQDFVIA